VAAVGPTALERVVAMSRHPATQRRILAASVNRKV
jgi:hypothetical protein